MAVKNGIFKLIFMDGVLIGNYSNEHSNGVYYPECARRIGSKSMDDDFVGEYDDVWFEEDHSPHIAKLIITLKDNIYTLNWENPNKPAFKGIAQRVDNTLYGTYVSIENK
jgi:hypothetical protein